MRSLHVLLVALPILAIGGCIVAFAQHSKPGTQIHAFDGASEWLNSEPLTAAKLEGKVVLVSFWTYTCVNWIRTQPYLRAWAKKYEDQGLVVIGVHSPEFTFERELGNVTWAVGDLRVNYPVVLDNEFSIWRAFDNHYWPALYFIDAQGLVRHHTFGEGNYGESERVIQKLLNETGAKATGPLVSVAAVGLEANADRRNLGSPETYLGSGRGEGFASVGGAREGVSHDYSIPAQLRVNQWALGGDWTIQREAARLDEKGGTVSYRFHARDVNLVMGPTVSGTRVPFRVLIDGQPPGDAHGTDTDKNGFGFLANQRLYQLVRQPFPVVDSQVSVEFLEGGAQLFAFTFG